MSTRKSLKSIDQLKHPHLKGEFACATCQRVYLHRASLNNHRSNCLKRVNKSKMIATAAGQSQDALLPKKAHNNSKVRKSLSPCSSDSSSNVSSTCSTPVVSPKEITPQVEGTAEEPMNEFQSLTSEIIGNMLNNGWYSDEQLVLPETWIKMVGEAQTMAQNAFKKTAKQQKRGTKRVRAQ